MLPRISAARLLRGLPIPTRTHVRSVWAFARTSLSRIARRSGDSYAQHGLELALVLRESTTDPALLSAALLHDVLLHPSGLGLLQRSPLTAEERNLAGQLHALRRLHLDENTRDLDAFLRAFAEDERLLILRMAHRLNDVRHLRRFTLALQRRIAHETLHIYTAIAGRIGMHTWRTEMEDICFKFLHPRIAKSLERKYAVYRAIDDACLHHASLFLKRALHGSRITCAVSFRKKGIYSTYRKMVLKRRAFEELTDRLAIRLVVPDRDDCYRALGVVHRSMHPIPGKLKDYIGAPKENGYRSIHTVVYPLPGVTEQPMEIQIRAQEMHAFCEFGPASHGDYKHSVYSLDSGRSRVHLLSNLEALRSEARSPHQFEEVLRRYFRDDHLAVFDGENNLYHLKNPATSLDLICLAFPKKFPHLARLRINGRHRPFGTPLRDGDTIEPSFAHSRTITPAWIPSCRHQLTKRKIREALDESGK
ncbi:MAG: HD domain-containing protein [Candidatus Peribacteraceae bacterium]|nr:HD domain-containing protein [Candidatus Peribacteraceae bacterium]